MSTFAQSYLAAKIKAYDALLTLFPQHPRDRAWSDMESAARVAFPEKPEPQLRQELRACFPQLNTRWHA